MHQVLVYLSGTRCLLAKHNRRERSRCVYRTHQYGIPGASLHGRFPPPMLAHKEIIQQNNVNEANIRP